MLHSTPPPLAGGGWGEGAALASEPLRQFLQAARSAGIRVSAAEGIDAARAVRMVGYSDRAVLKDTLSLVLAKTPDEKHLFDECFDLYFRRDSLAEEEDEAATDLQMPITQGGLGGEGTGGGGGRSLSQLLLDDDRAALAAAMEEAARESGIQNIRFFTQKNLYARRILDRMGLRQVERDMEALRKDDRQATADRLENRIEALRDQARDLVERNLLLFARGETEKFREELLKSARLSNLERRDLERMRVLVRAMAKRLAARYAKTRRRRLRGHLDVRRTLRRNMGWGGVPFVTVWKQKRIEKPRVMVLCDVSGSVAAMAQFLLMFLYALNEALKDIRSFAFAGSLIEVSDILEAEPIETAIAKIMQAIGFGSSNYGNSLADFEDGWERYVSNKTTIIILGDARGNRTDPRTDIMQRLSQRAKRIIWLNPEFRSAWGTGDSDMFRYAPYCNVVTVCNTLRHLERVVIGPAEGCRLTRQSAFPLMRVASAIVSHSSSTMRPTSASSSPSAMTRISGSVPLSRITRRPEPFSFASAAAIATLDALAAQRRGAGEAHILQHLRQWREHPADLAGRAPLLDDAPPGPAARPADRHQSWRSPT